jgi:hypothetical protein
VKAVSMSSDLLATAAELWPGAEVVPSGAAADGRPVRARFALLGHGAAPTVLVPIEPAAAAAASLRRTSGATGWWTSVSRTAAGAAVRAVPRLLGRQVEVRGGEPGLSEHLGEILGEQVCFSISIGSARVNRKPVLQLFDRHGRCRAFGKVGWSPHTCADVAAEGRALTAVGARRLDAVVPPELLARTTWHGHPVILTQPLRPRRWPPGRGHQRSRRPPVKAMDEVAQLFAEDPAPLPASAWWARQWQGVGDIADPVTRSRMARAMDEVARVAADRPLAWGAWHGDWTPWNMAVDGPRTLLWDWERFETGVPTGLDRIHYVLNVATAGASFGPDSVLRAIDMALREPSWSGGDREVTARLYLVAILVRYLRLTDVPGGEHIAERADQVLIALERRCFS